MKKLFTLLFSLSLGSSVFAQTLVMEHDSSNCSDNVSASIFTCDNHVINNGSDSAHLKWTRTEISMTPGWHSTICDVENCFSASTSTNMFALKPNQSGIVKVNFIPDNIEGSGIVKINITSTDGFGYNLNSYYFGSTMTTGTSTPSIQEIKDILLYPTPVRENVYVVFNPTMKPERLDVYNLLGQKVKSFPVQLEHNSYKTELQLTDLDKGLYFIRVYQQGSNLVITKQFTKE